MSVGRSLMDEEVETSSLGNGTSLRRSLARPFREPASRQRLLQRPTATRDRNQSQFAPCCPALPSLPPLPLVAVVPLLNLSQGQSRSIPSILTLLPGLD